MAKSNNREIVKLVSSEGTGFFYTTKRKRTGTKLERKKYDPKLRKHVTFKEGKVK
jgi:large subunit ribosomal protein L33